MLTLKLFLSSPGDVADERRLALETVRALEDSPLLRERVNLIVVAWDDPVASSPLDARETPQQSINRWAQRPSDCDLTIVVLWSRLGTPLPASMKRPDGSTFESGTVWEVEDAIAADRPVFVYRRTEKPRIELDDPDLEAKRAQYEAVRKWFERLRERDGAWRAGVNEYENPARFQQLLRAHLEAFIVRQLNPGDAMAAEDRTRAPSAALAASETPTPAPAVNRTDFPSRSTPAKPASSADAGHDKSPPRAAASPQMPSSPLPGTPMSRRWIIPALIVALVLAGALVLNRRGDRAPEASAAKRADAGTAEPTTPVQPAATEVPTGAATPPHATRAAVPTVRLDGPPDVVFSQMRPSTYTVLALKPEPGTSTHWRLRVRVRLAAASNSGGMNFWDSSFRLQVDGVPRAPVSNLNELVESGEAKDGDVLFDVPWAVQSLALLVNHYRENAEWPIAVSGTRAPAPLAFPAGPRPVALDAPADVSFPKSPPTVYSILAVGTESRRPGVVGLRVRVRMHVLEGADANFWDSRFRLVVDGVPRAPDSNLNELVGGRAAKDADITFEFPETARQLALRIVHNANDTADLPLKFISKP